MVQAREFGHEVTVLLRSTGNPTIQHRNLRVLEGNVLVHEGVAAAVEGQDAVVRHQCGTNRWIAVHRIPFGSPRTYSAYSVTAEGLCRS